MLLQSLAQPSDSPLHQICTKFPRILLMVVITVARADVMLGPGRKAMHRGLVPTEWYGREWSVSGVGQALPPIQTSCLVFFWEVTYENRISPKIVVTLMSTFFLCSIGASCLASELTLLAYRGLGARKKGRVYWLVTSSSTIRYLPITSGALPRSL